MIKPVFALALYFIFFLQNVDAKTLFAEKLADTEIEHTQHDVTYDGSYYSIKYPGGDVSKNIDIFCSDEIVCSHRVAGIDLQHTFYEDILFAYEITGNY